MTIPPPDPELKRLEPLLGTWRSEEHTRDSVLGPRGVNCWGYDADAGRFRTEDGNRYEGVVEDDTLTFEGPARFQYRLDELGKIRVNDDGTISVAWWLRDENGEWPPWMDNRFEKVEG